MKWWELVEFVREKEYDNEDWSDEQVQFYDKERGEYYPLDFIEFETGDDIVPDGKVFLTIGE
jgi:hypothetical protein|tara:strand:- start:409 stop:594 length:186 start_codon:yes stop_codon:yes gene_type:complete